MKKYFSFLLVLILFISWISLSADEVQSVNKFWNDFKSEVIKVNKDNVADMTNFPLFNNSDKLPQKHYTRNEFLNKYNEIFDPSTINTIQNTSNLTLRKSDASEESFNIYVLEFPEGYSFLFRKFKDGNFKFYGIM